MSTERILIVEDDGIAAIGLEATLTQFGYKSVGIAFTAEEAVQKALKEGPDLILMDIKLKGERDGITAAEEIHRTFDVPIIYITAFSDIQTLERAKISAPYGYLLKPFREESIKTTIEIGLNTYRLEKKLRETEQDFRTLFELSPVGTLLISADQTILRANAAFAKQMGFNPEEQFEGKPLADFFVEEDKETLSLHHAALFSNLQPKTGEYKAKRKNGNQIWVLLQSAIIHEANSRAPIGLYSISDISAQKEVEEHLRTTADVLSESNQKLQEFTSIASHDLKAPARVTGAYVSLLAHEYADKLDDRGREFLGYAISGAKQMQATVEDLLEYTKVCHSPSQKNPISLNKIVRDTLAIINPEIEEKRASVTYDFLPTVWGSETQLRRLFGNLISNAIKFNRSKPQIHISASQSSTGYTVAVSDNGVGIPESEMKDIFEIFHRAHPKSEFPGTGIGLASCKKVMENHRGQIWVKSVEGNGSTFFLHFPLHLGDEVDLPPPPVQTTEKARLAESMH